MVYALLIDMLYVAAIIIGFSIGMTLLIMGVVAVRVWWGEPLMACINRCGSRVLDKIMGCKGKENDNVRHT